MAETLWQIIRNRLKERNPFSEDFKTYDPRMSVYRDGRDVTHGGTIPLDVRSPYQIATDPRMMTGTGPGLAQVEHPQYSSAIPRGNIGEGARGVPRKEDFKNPFESLGKTADENNKFLKMLFYQSLIAGTAGDDPPQPYTVQVGPAVRPWTPINMYGRGLQ